MTKFPEMAKTFSPRIFFVLPSLEPTLCLKMLSLPSLCRKSD